MNRISLRKIVPPKAELGDREQACNQDADGHRGDRQFA